MDRFRCNEGEGGWTIAGQLRDGADVAIPLSAISTATLTLLNAETYVPGASPAVGIINSRDGQNVLNQNNVVITDGQFVWTVQSADTPIVVTRRQLERHRALFLFSGSGFNLPYECEIEVVNLRKTV